MQEIRRAGWAFTVPPRPTRLHGMAVPILDKDRVVGCISLRFPRSAMSEEEVSARYGKRLQTLARAIAAEIARQQS